VNIGPESDPIEVPLPLHPDHVPEQVPAEPLPEPEGVPA